MVKHSFCLIKRTQFLSIFFLFIDTIGFKDIFHLREGFKDVFHLSIFFLLIDTIGFKDIFLLHEGFKDVFHLHEDNFNSPTIWPVLACY